jgi:hypothetical protein
MQALSEVVQEHSSLLHLGVDDRKKVLRRWSMASVTRKLSKISPNFGKSGQKYKNIYIKAKFQSLKSPYQTTFETSTYPQQTCIQTVCLVKNWLSKKLPKWQNFA